MILSAFTILTMLVLQDTTVIEHGDPAISGSKIEAFDITWEQKFHGPDGEITHQRYVDEKVELIEIDGVTHLKRSQVFRNPDGSKAEQHNLVLANSFIPVRWEDKQAGGGRTHFDFYGRMIKGAYINGVENPAVIIQRELEIAPFDQRIAGLLISSLPLQKGYTAKFPMAPLRPPRFNEPNISWFSFSVTGKERIDTPTLGTVTAWRVESSQTFTYWISEEEPYVVRVTFPLRGGESVFEVVKIDN